MWFCSCFLLKTPAGVLCHTGGNSHIDTVQLRLSLRGVSTDNHWDDCIDTSPFLFLYHCWQKTHGVLLSYCRDHNFENSPWSDSDGNYEKKLFTFSLLILSWSTLQQSEYRRIKRQHNGTRAALDWHMSLIWDAIFSQHTFMTFCRFLPPSMLSTSV